MKRFAPLIALIALAACETMPTPGVAPSVTAPMVGELDLGGAWRTQAPAPSLEAFSRVVASRYGPGTPTPRVLADLQHASFACTENHDSSGRGAPPTQICRRTEVANGCTNTWQVHLFGTQALTRARALYDRRCGGDALLGGPG